MRIWLVFGMLLASTVSAYAAELTVPEIDASSGLAAMGVVGSIAALYGNDAGANRRVPYGVHHAEDLARCRNASCFHSLRLRRL